ncbi:CreA protein [Pseudochelatococcus contaminans]|uniref:CreA protein n=2 Tax=Pseudochelatococcus contaminans TaxID=1538103 RepID=A0A7W5Z0X0_9HYPH|nr:CreA protein [Pseudochelatococcus contaminans]
MPLSSARQSFSRLAYRGLAALATAGRDRLLAPMLLALALMLPLGGATAWADGPDLIFKKSTVWKMLTPDHKLAVYGIDDPVVSGVACHFTTPEKGGLGGFFGVSEEVSDISLSCHQTGPISFNEKFEQGDVVFSERRSLLFKRMQIVRGCDEKRNTLIYLVYSDKLIEGSPKNATSAVPVTPWGGGEAQRCADWLKR